MPPVPPPQQPPPPPDNGVAFSTFSGLKNTVGPENLTERQLARARNIDLDDLGNAARRRGRRRAASGRWHSLFTTGSPAITFGVQDGTLVAVNPDFTVAPLLAGIAEEPMGWVQVGPVAYFSSIHNSGQIDLASLRVSPWGRVRGPSYQPSLDPGPDDWWFSPVPRSALSATLGPGGGKLLGAPPLGRFLGAHNGRVYIGSKNLLWATELYLYNYVDKNRGYRVYEHDITGIQSVEDGIYVGTTEALYFLSGTFADHTRKVCEPSGVLPGSMVLAPGELVDPEGRRFPDLPRGTSKAMTCMTHAGMVVGLPGGQTFNLTRNEFVFPKAFKAAAMLRHEDGINTYVVAQSSGGTPRDNAQFGDYLSAEIIRAKSPGQPGQPSGAQAKPALQDPFIKPRGANT
jgi:hypothetical protein